MYQNNIVAEQSEGKTTLLIKLLDNLKENKVPKIIIEDIEYEITGQLVKNKYKGSRKWVNLKEEVEIILTDINAIIIKKSELSKLQHFKRKTLVIIDNVDIESYKMIPRKLNIISTSCTDIDNIVNTKIKDIDIFTVSKTLEKRTKYTIIDNLLNTIFI